MDSKRVNFVLEKSMYLELKKRAEKQGVPVSKIITSWIENFSLRGAKISQQKVTGKLTTYNFWLNRRTYLLLEQISASNNVQISTLLRSLIYNNINQTNGSESGLMAIKAKTLWTSGQLLTLKSFLYENFDKLSDELKILLAKVYLELGDFDKTRNLITLLSDNKNAMLQLINSEMLIIQGDIQSAKNILHKIENDKYASNNNYVDGLINFQLGLIYSKLKNPDKGQLHLHKAINSFDIINSPIELAKSYLFMTDFLEFNQEFEVADKYYERSADIFSAIGNDYYCGWVAGGNAFNAYLRGDHENGLYFANKAVAIDSKVGSRKQQAYSLGVKGRVCLIGNNYDSAIDNLGKALDLQSNKKSQTNTLNLLNLLAKSRYSTKEIAILEDLLSGKDNNNSDKQIFLHTAKFLFSDKNITKEEGRLGLVQMSKDKTYSSQIRSSAKNILEEKRICPIAI